MKADIGIITGTGLYALEGLADSREVEIASRFGFAQVTVGTIGDRRVVHIPRHGPGHELLPNTINYRANVFALAELEVRLLLLTTAVGIVDGSLPLGRMILFDDLYFPENRLPDGAVCTMHTEEGDPLRGHYIFDKPFSLSFRKAILDIAEREGMELTEGGLYAQVNGPRFNSRPEIAFLQRLGMAAISQTAGIEVVLAGEMEIPVALIGFGVDYANGVRPKATPEAALRENLAKGRQELTNLALAVAAEANLDSIGFDQGFIYRF